jgi:hypothetical protein
VTKPNLRRQVTVLRDQLWEIEARMRALELRLSEHLRDSERHARPHIDPADGATPGDGTITCPSPRQMWQHSPFVIGWVGAMPEEDDA